MLFTKNNTQENAINTEIPEQENSMEAMSFDDKAKELGLMPPPVEDEEEIERRDLAKQIEMTDEFFGVLLPLIQDTNITDVDWNGHELWITDCQNNRMRADKKIEDQVTDTFVQKFASRIAMSVSKEFNRLNPVLEAETDTLRISILHPSVAHTGTSFCIRQTPNFLRLSMDHEIETGYITPEIAAFLINAVTSRMNIIVCGGVGVGKTEFIKLLAQYVTDTERIITIEDNLELHLSEIDRNTKEKTGEPYKDIIEMQVSNTFNYLAAIKACLRHNPQWMMISEIRGVEAEDYITGLTTGVNGITSLHTDDARKVPDRIVNMTGNINQSEKILQDVYSFLDVAVLVARRDVNGQMARFIDQVVVFSNENGRKEMTMIFNNKKSVPAQLSDETLLKFERYGVDNPFYHPDVEKISKEKDIEYDYEGLYPRHKRPEVSTKMKVQKENTNEYESDTIEFR